jgi:hypothetical protein
MSFAGFLAPAAWIVLCFGGSAGVTFFSGQFDVSPELVRQIAGFHGYFLRSQTSTRAQGVLVTYARFR